MPKVLNCNEGRFIHLMENDREAQIKEDLDYSLSGLSSYLLQLLYQGTIAEFDIARRLFNKTEELKLAKVLSDIRTEMNKFHR